MGLWCTLPKFNLCICSSEAKRLSDENQIATVGWVKPFNHPRICILERSSDTCIPPRYISLSHSKYLWMNTVGFGGQQWLKQKWSESSLQNKFFDWRKWGINLFLRHGRMMIAPNVLPCIKIQAVLLGEGISVDKAQLCALSSQAQNIHNLQQHRRDLHLLIALCTSQWKQRYHCATGK